MLKCHHDYSTPVAFAPSIPVISYQAPRRCAAALLSAHTLPPTLNPRPLPGPGPGKLAKRKHQIGSLYAHAKLKELEDFERRAAGMKTKAETQSKYGW